MRGIQSHTSAVPRVVVSPNSSSLPTLHYLLATRSQCLPKEAVRSPSGKAFPLLTVPARMRGFCSRRGLTSSSRDRSVQGQRRMAPETPPSFTRPSTSGASRETQHQKTRAQAAAGSSTSISGHSQFATMGNGAPAPPRSSTNTSSTQRSHRQEHDLLGLTSPASNTDHGQYRPILPPVGRMQQGYVCPYHGSILQGRPADPRSGQGPGPMDRYLAEGPSEQHAMFYRADTGELSTTRGCQCYAMTQGNMLDPRMTHK